MFKKLSDLFHTPEFESRKSSYSPRGKSSDRDPDIIDFHELVNNWEKIVGKKLAENTIPLKNQNRNLTILTNHPSYAQQLSFMEKVLKDKIFQKYPKFKNHIKKILFKSSTTYFDTEKNKIIQRAEHHGKKESSDEKIRGKYHPQNPEYRELYQTFQKEYEYINDPETKERLISIAIQRKLLS